MKIFHKLEQRLLNTPFWKLVGIFIVVAGVLVIGYSYFLEEPQMVCYNQFKTIVPCPPNITTTSHYPVLPVNESMNYTFLEGSHG